MKNLKNKKGITLIALIVTIIVMLILVAVSVNVVIKSDIMGSAKKAAKDWENEQQKESKLGDIEVDGEEYRLNEYIKNVTGVYYHDEPHAADNTLYYKIAGTTLYIRGHQKEG